MWERKNEKEQQNFQGSKETVFWVSNLRSHFFAACLVLVISCGYFLLEAGKTCSSEKPVPLGLLENRCFYR